MTLPARLALTVAVNLNVTFALIVGVKVWSTVVALLPGHEMWLSL